MVTFRNKKKKDWFSRETELVFVHDDVFKDGSRNSATFKIKFFATIGNGKSPLQANHLYISTIFTGKIKIGRKWPCLEARH